MSRSMSRSLHFFDEEYRMGCEGSVMEDPDSEYDSTWDDEYEEETFGMMGVTKQRTLTVARNLAAARDMQKFRHRCRENGHAHHSHGQGEPSPNLDFYQNKRPSRPDGIYINQFHQDWFRDYTKLERVHSYIQWLFPTQEPGLNYDAHVLTPREIWHFHDDKIVQRKLLRSYKLMLDFFGIQLVSEETGMVQRANNWKERFENLNRNPHNNLRITRILKCLGLLGFHHYQAPLVRFFLQETLVKGTLPQVKQSTLDYFIFAVLDRSDRKDLIKYAFYYFEPKELFVWCPRRIQRKLMKRTTQRIHPSQTPAGARRHVKHHKPDQNSRRNSERNAGPSKMGPRKAHPPVKKYTTV